ncbi:DUF1330 domain-containing protein [Pseudoalteromonas distincta]|uniref:DUF1330 domain-containing protein n=1 Tax=Pseudoalteromonas distincta TaxID=77608 RepID=UPI0030D9EAB8
MTNYSIDPTKLEGYADYPQKASAVTTQFGGRLLVASMDNKIVEGNPEEVTVVIEFESKEQAQKWYYSKEYTAIKDLRINATKAGWLIFADQFEAS